MSHITAGIHRREISISLLIAAAFGLLLALVPGAPVVAQDATPPPSSCADVMSMATPMAGHGSMQPATPQAHDMSAMDEMVEFDLAYIDMMIPHHQSIIALARVALPELTDPRLIEMAEAIIETQRAEIEELQSLRDEWYPNAAPVGMEMMMEAMPGPESSMEFSMQELMSVEFLAMTFCMAENKDLAFIELTIPHHQMAVEASEEALEQAVHPELAELAEDVIEAQQEEIDLLMEIRADLTGDATPAS